MNTFDPTVVHAHCLYDAAINFPEPLRTRVRTPFKARFSQVKPVIEGMSLDAHIGLTAVPEGSTDHYWFYDLRSGAKGGTLTQCLCKTFGELQTVTDTSRLTRLLAKMAHLCCDAFIGPNLLDFEDGDAVRLRVAQDVKAHVGELPYLDDSIVHGDNFKPATPFSDIKATELFLGFEGWSNKNREVANYYLFGNGWPAAKPVLCECYNKACNMLVRAVEKSR